MKYKNFKETPHLKVSHFNSTLTSFTEEISKVNLESILQGIFYFDFQIL